MSDDAERFTSSGEFTVPRGPPIVHMKPLGGPLLPGRLAMPTIQYEGREYVFDGVDAQGWRYVLRNES